MSEDAGIEPKKIQLIEENAEINQLLALMEVGHEVHTAATYRVVRLSAKVFISCGSVARSWLSFSARAAENSAKI